MSIEFHCFACGQRLRVADEHHGQRARCARCEVTVDVPPLSRAALPLTSPGKHRADVIDYELSRTDPQHVEITLDRAEIVLAPREHLFYKSAQIQMESVPGSELKIPVTPSHRYLPTGLTNPWSPRSWLMESWFGERTSHLLAFRNMSEDRQIIAFSPRQSGRLIPLHLDELGGEVLFQLGSLLCMARGVRVESPRPTALMEAADALSFHRLLGDGVAILHAEGAFVHRMLHEQDALHVAMSRIVALEPRIRCRRVANSRLPMVILQGPGEVWLQSIGTASIV